MNESETRDFYHQQLDQELVQGKSSVPKEKIRARVNREANTRDLLLFGCSIVMLAALALVSRLAFAVTRHPPKSTGDTK